MKKVQGTGARKGLTFFFWMKKGRKKETSITPYRGQKEGRSSEANEGRGENLKRLASRKRRLRLHPFHTPLTEKGGDGESHGKGYGLTTEEISIKTNRRESLGSYSVPSKKKGTTSNVKVIKKWKINHAVNRKQKRYSFVNEEGRGENLTWAVELR